MRTIATALALALTLAAAHALWAVPTESEARKRIVDIARSFKGVPYVYGAESPEAFDCSGFVRYVYARAAEIALPRNSIGQYGSGKSVGMEAAKPGDVLVFDTVGGAPSHVAILMGDGTMIHAASEGPRTGVIVSSIKDPYFGPRFLGARCYILGATPAAPTAAATPAPAKPAEVPVAQIGFTLRSTPAVVTDRIPAVTGTAIAFTITNGTGKDGVFHINFYKANADFSKTKILREDRAAIRAGASRSIPAWTFTEPGVYRLNVKTAGNTQLMQRSWKVVDAKG